MGGKKDVLSEEGFPHKGNGFCFKNINLIIIIISNAIKITNLAGTIFTDSTEVRVLKTKVRYHITIYDRSAYQY